MIKSSVNLQELENQASGQQGVNIEELSRYVQTNVSAASRNRQSPAFFDSGPVTAPGQ